MKRTFIVTLSAVSLGMLFGCTKNDLLQTQTGREVTFSTHVDGTTKGSTKVEFKVGDQFGLMATESAAAWSNTDATWYMGGGTDSPVVVTNTQTSGGTSVWKYNPVKLWPEKNKVSFFAYSPLADGANGISNVKALAGSPTLDFVVNDDIKSQIDLMRAEALDKFEEDVQLAFSHALTRVTFAAKANVTANQRVRLDKIELRGIKKKGTLTFYDQARVAGALNDLGGWSAAADTTTYSPALTHEVASLITTDLMPMTDEDQALFMLPQQFVAGGGAKLAVTYSYSNDNGKKWVNNSQFEIDLAEYTEYWNPSKNYRYVLTLSPDNVYSFGATIESWDAEIDVTVKNPFSVASLDIDPTGGLPSEVVITETRGQALGYTLRSNAPTWITISDQPDGTGAKAEVTYGADGTTKAYEMDKKWYLKLVPNTTGAPRNGSVLLVREGMADEKIVVTQPGFSPFKNVPTFPQADAYAVNPTTKAGEIFAVKGAGWVNKLIAPTGFKISLDGVGAGLDSVEVVGNDGLAPAEDFYVHTTINIKRTVKSGNVELVAVNVDGKRLRMGTYAVSQEVNPDIYVGNFAGEMKTETVGDETWWYRDKLLFAKTADEGGTTYKLLNLASNTGLTDRWDGKANTAALQALAAPNDSPAAKACTGEYYLPAINQLMGAYIARPILSSANATYWSSTRHVSYFEYHCIIDFFSGEMINDHVVSSGRYKVRCVREVDVPGVVAAKVIKDATGKVYIDVQGMPSGTWSSSSLAGAHTETSATNSLFKRIEIGKSDKSNAPHASPGCDAGWRLPTQREFMLIWTMKDMLVQAGVNGFTENEYWSGTKYSADSRHGWYFDFSLTGRAGYDSATSPRNIRCIREVN